MAARARAFVTAAHDAHAMAQRLESTCRQTLARKAQARRHTVEQNPDTILSSPRRGAEGVAE